MSVTSIFFRPALRMVNATGSAVTFGPHELAVAYGARQNGVYLANCNVEYVAEVFGPRLFADQHESVTLKGYRPRILLDFELLEYDPSNLYAYGCGLIQNYYDAGMMASELANGLQFNLFIDNALSAWRNVYPASAWNPVPARGKQTSPGASVTLELRGREQFRNLGNYLWANRTW